MWRVWRVRLASGGTNTNYPYTSLRRVWEEHRTHHLGLHPSPIPNMPALPISFGSALRSVELPREKPTLESYSTIFSTSLGLTLIEIQGDLSLPKSKPEGLSEKEESLFFKKEIPRLFQSLHELSADNGEVIDVVKFGKLEIDNSLKHATLFISTTQRLIGSVEKIDPPLGLLKVDYATDHDGGENQCEMLDIIDTKIIFKQRPLPIM